MKFLQLIRKKNQEIHKERIIKFVSDLNISEDSEYECVIKPYSKSKTLEQLGYYWGVIIPTTRLWQGITPEEADLLLKKQCIEPIFKEIMGEVYEIRKSIAKMKVKEMRDYVDDCINFLGIHCQVVPSPEWSGK